MGFDEFVAARSPRLLRLAYLLAHDWAAAEDLLQTALAKSWLRWDRIDGDPEPYVRAVLVNTYISAGRRFWRREVPTEILPDRCADPTDATEALATRDLIWTALARLPRRRRAVIVLRYVEDLTEAQTAQVLGISTGTVKSQTAKALAALRIDPELVADHAAGSIPLGGER